MEEFSIMTVKRHQINVDIEAELRRMAHRTGRLLIVEEYEEPEDYPVYPAAAMTVQMDPPAAGRSAELEVVSTRNTWNHEYDQEPRDGFSFQRQSAAEVPQPASANRLFNAADVKDEELVEGLEAMANTGAFNEETKPFTNTERASKEECSQESSEKATIESEVEVHDDSILVSRKATEPSPVLTSNGRPLPHSCTYCSDKVIDSEKLIGLQKLILSRSRHTIAKASDNGCPLFRWLEWHLYTVPEMESGPSAFSEISLELKANPTSPYKPSQVQGVFRDWDRHTGKVLRKGNFGSFSLVATKDDPAASYVSTRPVNLDVGSEESFRVAQSWLKECHNSHELCKQQSPATLPTRVLDVSNGRVKLHTTSKGEAGNYVALSYCWGGDQLAKATIATISSLAADIPLSDLPQSLQDAVKVTRSLGINFLWIDSLCIIQDDPKDVAEEISKMPSIYSESYCTISAANSSSSHHGFLQPREPSSNRRHIFSLPYLCPTGTMGQAYLCIKEKHDPKSLEPIYGRAWTLQESLLSNRTLVYGAWQTRWICKSCNQSDGGPIQGVYHQPLESLGGRLHSPIRLEDIPAPQQTDSREERLYKHFQPLEIMGLWDDIVHEYTRRGLSVPSDRDVAISGLAHAYSRLIGGKYLAGLWEHSIASGLLWKRPLLYKHPLSTGPFTPRRFPTWSWTSVSGPVDMQSPLSLSSSPIAKVVGFQSIPALPSAPFGSVEFAYVAVQGRMKQATYIARHPILRNTLRFSDSPGGDDPTYMATARWDEADPDPMPEDDDEDEGKTMEMRTVYCLELLPFNAADSSSSGPVRPAGLLLQKVRVPPEPCDSSDEEKDDEGEDEKFMFIRVGYFDFEWDNIAWLVAYEGGSRDHDERRLQWKSEVFEDCEVQNMIII